MDKMQDIRRQTLALLVDNEPGVLSQIARLFSRKGYNIEAFAAGPTENPGVTRITIDVLADEPHTELLCNQLRKLYPIHSVKWLNAESSIYRELMLVKVRAETSDRRNDIIQLANIFRAQIIDVSLETLTLGITGDAEKIMGLVNIVKEFEILEIARTGVVAIERGKATINDNSKESGEFNYGKNVL
jgi:acetolactate synthase-1/3 small subunit